MLQGGRQLGATLMDFWFHNRRSVPLTFHLGGNFCGSSGLNESIFHGIRVGGEFFCGPIALLGLFTGILEGLADFSIAYSGLSVSKLLHLTVLKYLSLLQQIWPLLSTIKILKLLRPNQLRLL